MSDIQYGAPFLPLHGRQETVTRSVSDSREEAASVARGFGLGLALGLSFWLVVAYFVIGL